MSFPLKPVVNKKRVEINMHSFGKNTNQALQLMLARGLNVETEKGCKEYIKLTKMFYRLDLQAQKELEIELNS